MAYQVVVGELADVTGLNAQVLECLCCRIDGLVDELAINVLGRQDWPPKCPIEQAGDGLQDCLRDVDMRALFEDFSVDELRDLRGRVVFRPKQLKGLGRCAVIEE